MLRAWRERDWDTAALAAVGVGATVRAVWILAIHHPFAAPYIYSDMYGYVNRAKALSLGHITHYAAFYPPGTHALIAFPLELFGRGRSGFWGAAVVWWLLSSLTPLFAFQLSVAGSGNQVIYGRLFDGPGGSIRQVRPDGSVAGLTVDLSGGAVSVRGPLDLSLTVASYPLRSASEALAAANVRQAAGTPAFDRAELVYVVVVSRGHGYYEPALLLTGPSSAVLAPVIAPPWLGS